MLTKGDPKHFRLVNQPKTSKAAPVGLKPQIPKRIEDMTNIELFSLISKTENADILEQLSLHPQRTVSNKAKERAEKLGIILEENA